MPTLNYSVPTTPANMSLKARLAYAYLFYEDSDWHCVKTTTDHWIIVIGNNLNDAEICPDEESFIAWLEQIAEENLEDDPKEFISALFVSHGVRIDDLIDDEVAESIGDGVGNNLLGFALSAGLFGHIVGSVKGSSVSNGIANADSIVIHFLGRSRRIGILVVDGGIGLGGANRNRSFRLGIAHSIALMSGDHHIVAIGQTSERQFATIAYSLSNFAGSSISALRPSLKSSLKVISHMRPGNIAFIILISNSVFRSDVTIVISGKVISQSCGNSTLIRNVGILHSRIKELIQGISLALGGIVDGNGGIICISRRQRYSLRERAHARRDHQNRNQQSKNLTLYSAYFCTPMEYIYFP